MRIPTKTILISLSLIILILFGFLFYVLYKIRTQNQKVINLEVQAEELKQMDNIAQTIRFTKNNTGDDLARLDNLILSQDKIVPFIENVEGIGKQMGLKTQITSVSTDETNVFVEIDTEGEWIRSMDFVHAVENLPLKVTIDEMAITFLGDLSQKWHTRISLSLPFISN